MHKGDPTASSEAGPYGSGHTTFPENTSTGGDVTALCMNCHRQETGGVPDVLAGYKVPAGSAASTLVIGGSHGAPPVGFVSHSHGTQFLNSPHARMSGTWNQIGCPPVSISPSGIAGCDSSMATYNSDFANAAIADGISTPGSYTGSSQIAGGCTACHDVHGTVLENAAGQSDGSTRACTACHINPADTLTPQINLSVINHPSGMGTPLNDSNPCAVCHMPKGQHIFRISTDPNYTEFPAAALAADMPAPTAPDADGFPAVWVDVDQACGQCHGGSAGASSRPNLNSDLTGTPVYAPYATKADLAAAAAIMHSGTYSAPVSGVTPSAAHAGVTQTGYQVSFTDTSSDADDTSNLDAVTVNWGDGSTDAGVRGGSFTHTYSGSRVRSYAIVHVIRDSVDTKTFSKESIRVTVPMRYNVTGATSTNAYVYLKQGGHTRKIMKATDGAHSISRMFSRALTRSMCTSPGPPSPMIISP